MDPTARDMSLNLFDLKTQISTKYEDINDKYLVKLGSYGLFNRLQILKKIEESID